MIREENTAKLIKKLLGRPGWTEQLKPGDKILFKPFGVGLPLDKPGEVVGFVDGMIETRVPDRKGGMNRVIVSGPGDRQREGGIIARSPYHIKRMVILPYTDEALAVIRAEQARRDLMNKLNKLSYEELIRVVNL